MVEGLDDPRVASYVPDPERLAPSRVESAAHRAIALEANMPRTWFSPAVFVESDRPGQSYAVTSLEMAAAMLREWPVRGRAWRKAVEVCAAASKGAATADEARRAFAAAAKAAGRLLDLAAA